MAPCDKRRTIHHPAGNLTLNHWQQTDKALDAHDASQIRLCHLITNIRSDGQQATKIETDSLSL